MRKNVIRRATVTATAVTVATVAIVAVTALPASAHVTVSPTSLPKGSTGELAFKVPNEESKATTTEVQLQIPTDHPIAQVLPRQLPGWTVTVKTTTLATPLKTDDGTFTTAVSEIDWTGGTIPVGQYQDFQISVDPLPTDTAQLVFKAVQTYSNGDIVRWIDLTQPGQPAPDHPAPVLTLTAADSSDSSSGGSGSNNNAAAANPSASAVAAQSSTGGSDSARVGIWLGALGLAAGLAALALTLVSRRRSGS
ncbi:MAG TPA: YcnI family protein [Actinocrinis sp.]|uniref:YcnI family copper-binding membrane protein n=1 Tax=Actinocrinis sp. TaxID=1920516 RepID=UPI002DDD39C0|nr:YcnI family protein [Actinocrinis sp.]HEV2344411.1 YcnI family protein [Actinocrinis sp.]